MPVDCDTKGHSFRHDGKASTCMRAGCGLVVKPFWPERAIKVESETLTTATIKAPERALPQTDKTTGMQELVVVPKYSPEDIERIAGVVLRAAGSDFKHYMPSSKELILAELTKVLTEKQEKE